MNHSKAMKSWSDFRMVRLRLFVRVCWPFGAAPSTLHQRYVKAEKRSSKRSDEEAWPKKAKAYSTVWAEPKTMK